MGNEIEREAERFVTERYEAGDTVFPSAVSRALGIPVRKAYESLEPFVREGLLGRRFALRCPRCMATISTRDSLADFSDETECPRCGLEFSVSLDSHVEAMYRRLGRGDETKGEA